MNKLNEDQVDPKQKENGKTDLLDRAFEALKQVAELDSAEFQNMSKKHQSYAITSLKNIHRFKRDKFQTLTQELLDVKWQPEKKP